MVGRPLYGALIERLRKRATIASLEHKFGLESDLLDAIAVIGGITTEGTEAGPHPDTLNG